MPCPFTGPKMFSNGPIFLCQTKYLFTHCGSHKHLVPKRWFTLCKIGFGLAQKIWTGTKHFGTCKRTRHKYTYIPLFSPTYAVTSHNFCHRKVCLYTSNGSLNISSQDLVFGTENTQYFPNFLLNLNLLISMQLKLR